MIKHFRIITKIYSYKQAGQMKILKLFLKIVYEDPARFFFKSTFCYYRHKQVHVGHPTDSGECLPHE